jgi:hypothetical protein
MVFGPFSVRILSTASLLSSRAPRPDRRLRNSRPFAETKTSAAHQAVRGLLVHIAAAKHIERFGEVVMQRVTSSSSFLLALLTLASVCGLSRAAPPPSPGALRLDAASYQVSEGAGMLTVTVTRVGGSLGQVSANLRTLDIIALEGKDYTRVFTMVTPERLARQPASTAP